MTNLKIKLNSESQAGEVKRLAVKAGYKLDDLFGKKWSSEFCYLVLCEDMSAGFGNEIMADGDKPLSIGELRAMVNPMKEYLVPDKFGYRIAVQDASLPIAEDWIVIPDGMNYAYREGSFIQFTKQEMGYRDSVLVWQRATHPEELPFIDDEPKYTDDEVKYMDENGQGRLQSLSDQYAEIEQVRQVEIHGTVKAEPDLNFGAAQASGGAKMRENNHYFINVSDVDEVDFYEIAKRYNVTDPAVQHILKKCLAIGNRGHKDLETDLKDILKTAKRALHINGFGE